MLRPTNLSRARKAPDRGQVHAWLSQEPYWALARPREVQDAAINASHNYGIYRKATREQVACARVTTDGTTFEASPRRRSGWHGKPLLAAACPAGRVEGYAASITTISLPCARAICMGEQ